MTPADILNRPMPKSPTCVDCNAPATIVDRPMPLCLRCARIVLKPGQDTEVCMACLMAYNRAEWDRCPNDDCVTNVLGCPGCGAMQDCFDTCPMLLANDPEAYGLDERDYYDAEADDDPLE